jgi:hypothetical protein
MDGRIPAREASGVLLTISYNGAIALQQAARAPCAAAAREAQPGRVMSMEIVKGLSMEKWLCWGSMGVAGVLLLLFALDLMLGIPFGQAGGIAVDICSILACALVIFLAWDASRDLL